MKRNIDKKIGYKITIMQNCISKLLRCISFTLVFVLLSTVCYGQASPKRVLGTFIFESSVYNYEFKKESSDNFNLVLSSISKNTDTTDSPKSDSLNYIFSEFEQLKFEGVFIKQMKDKFNISDTNSLRKTGTQIFFTVKAKLEFLDDEPVTANLILKRDSISSILKSSIYESNKNPLDSSQIWHRIDRVSVETEDGAIKNIIVRVIDPKDLNKSTQSPRNYIEFRNLYPISISSKSDPDRFADIMLYSLNCGGIKGLTRYIKLSELLLLDIVLENDKEDYSPSNRVLALSPSLPIVELKKEKRSKIIEVAAFSDFVGMDQEQPNGLIQIEAKRKINLNTMYKPFFSIATNEDIANKYDLRLYGIRKPIDSAKEFPSHLRTTYKSPPKNLRIVYRTKDSMAVDSIYVKKGFFSAPYYNFLGNIEPKLLFSKLEDNNKFLILDSLASADKKINALSIFQHQLASFGFTLNVLKIHFPQSKVNWNVVDLALFWYRTRVKNSTDSANTHSEALNSSYWNIATSVGFRPDSRWGVSLGASYLKQNLWNSLYKLDHNAGLFQACFDGHLKTNDDSKLFFRFRWTFDGHTFNNNFTQVQLGYSLNLFSTTSTPNNK